MVFAAPFAPLFLFITIDTVKCGVIVMATNIVLPGICVSYLMVGGTFDWLVQSY